MGGRGAHRRALRGHRPSELPGGRGDRLDRGTGRGEQRDPWARQPPPPRWAPDPSRVRRRESDRGGVFVGANGSVRDMSERDRLERELQASEERYRFLVENSPDIVFSIDADGLFTSVSETIEQITGWLPAQATGRHFGFLIAEHSQPTALERWETLRQDPTSLQVVELDLVRPDGSFVPVEVSAIGIAARDGRFAGIHGSTRDISERRRLERDLRESEERYRYLVRASPDVVWAVDDQGVLTFMGDRVTELTGWTPDELVGKRFDFLTMPEYLAQSEEIWEGVRRD